MKIASNAFEKLIEFHESEYDEDRCDLIYQECIELEEEDFIQLLLIANHLKSPKQQTIIMWRDWWRDNQLFTTNHAYLSSPYCFMNNALKYLLTGRRYETKQRVTQKYPYIQEQIDKVGALNYVIDDFVETKNLQKEVQRHNDFLNEEVIPLYKKGGITEVLVKYNNGW